MSFMRREQARSIRKAAARMARSRPERRHIPNGDEMAYRDARYAMTFTKGLAHDSNTLLAAREADVAALRAAIDGGYVDAFNAISRPADTRPSPKPIRRWEAPTAGFVHDLQGPDAQEVTMPAAPHLGSTEAYLRDGGGIRTGVTARRESLGVDRGFKRQKSEGCHCAAQRLMASRAPTSARVRARWTAMGN